MELAELTERTGELVVLILVTAVLGFVLFTLVFVILTLRVFALSFPPLLSPLPVMRSSPSVGNNSAAARAYTIHHACIAAPSVVPQGFI